PFLCTGSFFIFILVNTSSRFNYISTAITKSEPQPFRMNFLNTNRQNIVRMKCKPVCSSLIIINQMLVMSFIVTGRWEVTYFNVYIFKKREMILEQWI